MPMTAGQLEQMIRTALPDAKVDITDLRGDGDHYAAHVVSKALSAKPVCNSTKWFTMHWVAAWAIRCTLWPCKLPFPMTPEGGRYERN